jgi:hypothetical protein
MIADGETRCGGTLEGEEIRLEVGELPSGERDGLDEGTTHAREAEEGDGQHAGAELREVVGRSVGSLDDIRELDADEGLRVEQEHAVAMDDQQLVLAAAQLVLVQTHAREIKLLTRDEIGDRLVAVLLVLPLEHLEVDHEQVP